MPLSDNPFTDMHKLAKNTKVGGRANVSFFRPKDCRPIVKRHTIFCLGTEGIVENVRERV